MDVSLESYLPAFFLMSATAVPGAAAFTAALKTMKDLGAILTDPADVPTADDSIANPAGQVSATFEVLFHMALITTRIIDRAEHRP
jgi:hypothetical protein